jgi:metal-dependent HD superfamily phosphatase/phosphodiesterase
MQHNHVSAGVEGDEESPVSVYRHFTIDELRRDAEVVAFLRSANANMKAMGYTEHGQRHAGLVGNIAQRVLEYLGYDERTYQLANISGYLHDIGNTIHRENHALSGAPDRLVDPEAHGHGAGGVRAGDERHRQPRGGARHWRPRPSPRR